jgi:AraC family transcriptional regulator
MVDFTLALTPVAEIRVTPVLRLEHGEFIGHACGSAHARGFSFGEVTHTSTVRVPLHTHDDAHFVFILKGEYSTCARQVDSRRDSPTIIFNPPGTTHRDAFRSDVGRFFTVSVLPEQFRRLSDAGASVAYPVTLGSREVARLASSIVREFHHMDALSGVVLEGLGLELLAHTARSTEEKRRKHAPMWLLRAVELMRDRCSTPIAVREVAAEVGVHPYHLARTARSFFGKSPGELLREYRVDKALGLLTDTTVPIGVVALECGYADQSQFTRSFKSVTGTTPAVYRRDARATRAIR